jgi:hypothetical protein
MLKKPLQITVAFALCVVSVLVFAAGCTQAQRETSSIPSDKIILRVIEQVYDDGWKTVGEIVVRPDGSYCYMIHGLGKKRAEPERREGQLPGSLVNDIQKDISQRVGLEFVDATPTYRYGIDGHRLHHPHGIGQLLGFVAEQKEEGKKTSGTAGQSSVDKKSGNKEETAKTSPSQPLTDHPNNSPQPPANAKPKN